MPYHGGFSISINDAHIADNSYKAQWGHNKSEHNLQLSSAIRLVAISQVSNHAHRAVWDWDLIWQIKHVFHRMSRVCWNEIGWRNVCLGRVVMEALYFQTNFRDMFFFILLYDSCKSRRRNLLIIKLNHKIPSEAFQEAKTQLE